MTSTVDEATEQRLIEVIALIDQGLGDLSSRELVSAAEVADLLLDVRTLLASSIPVSPN